MTKKINIYFLRIKRAFNTLTHNKKHFSSFLKGLSLKQLIQFWGEGESLIFKRQNGALTILLANWS